MTEGDQQRTAWARWHQRIRSEHRVGHGLAVDASGENATGLLVFSLVAAVVGLLTGVVTATFRIVLEHLDRWRLDAVHAGHRQGWLLIAFVAVASGACALAAWLVHRVEPSAEGSGIPRVEAVVEGRAAPDRFRILPVKYVGGVLAIGSGLALGREGPSVQMGGAVAAQIGRWTRRPLVDIRILVAGGAAAGLATAFNAPIAAGVFALEELVKRFDPRTTLATLITAACGFAGARLILPDNPVYHVPAMQTPHLINAPWVALVGLLTGLLAVAYNRAVLAGLAWADTSAWSPQLRAALIGAVVGALGWFAPTLVGGGDNLTQAALIGQGAFFAAVGVLALRFVLAVCSYAARVPGGLFAPMLVLGAVTGEAVGYVARQFGGNTAPSVSALALIGMAAFFGAAVHAPVTGLVLVTEMTSSTVQLPPMLGATAIALLVATALRSQPIYELLTRRAVRNAALLKPSGVASGRLERSRRQSGHGADGQ